MKRDGAAQSLWQAGIDDYTTAIKNITEPVFDVLIAGGGITGLATALELQKAGKQCIIAEAHTLGFGTSSGTTAHLNTFFDTTYDQIRKGFGEDGAQLAAKAAAQSLALFKQNVETYAIDCGYKQINGYVYSQDDKQTGELESLYEATKAVGVAVEYTDRIPVPFEFQKAVVLSGQGGIHPTRYIMGLAKAFEAAGGIILQNTAIHNFEGGDIIEAETSRGTIKARNLLWATHIPPGINLLHFRCAPYRSYAIALTLADDAYPEDAAYDMYDPYHYYRTQEIDGRKYLIAGGEDHKTAHEENTAACFTRLEAYIRSHFKVAEVAFRWSSQYFEPADGIAYIGHLPGNGDNVWVATGFGGNGITYSHIAAVTLRDLLVKGESEFANLYNPGRIKPVAGFTNFVKENADVVAEFIGKRLSSEKITELTELATGEARVVKYEGQKLGLYKDEAGVVHAINPVCTHAKCIVGWNTAEKTWDCPCHGARYSPDGEVLTGPSVKGLEVVALEELAKD